MQWDDWRPRDARLTTPFQAWRDGQLDAARHGFESWIGEHPSDPDGWRGLGNVFWSAQEFGLCLYCYQQAVRYDTWNPMHWGNLGLVFRDLKRLAAADACFEICLAIDPDYAPGLNEWGNVFYDAGRYTAALALYNRSLAIDRNRAVVHHNRGVCLRALGDSPGAVESFHTALRIDPSYQHTLNELEVMKNGSARMVNDQNINGTCR
jgi:tetratricopeptide (TPR) repeat protein